MATPNMGISLPTPGVTPSQTWASLLNDALEIVDAHDHTDGNGVRITPAAININATLEFNSNALAEVGSVLLDDLAADIDDRGIYAKDGNLFYMNTDGDAVQITNGANIAGTAGSITGLTSPAGAAYSSLTKSFAWTYDSSKHARFAHGDLQLFPYDGSDAYTKAITLKAPVGLESGSSYSLTLPSALPGVTEYLSIDTSGNINHATLAGTSNQVNVVANATAITLSLPQNIHTAATPTFAGVTTSAASLGATTVTTLVGTSASFSGQVAGGSLTTGNGAFKVKTFTGTISNGGTATLDVPSGEIYSMSGRWVLSVGDGYRKPLAYHNVGSGYAFFDQSDGQDSDTVWVTNNVGASIVYYATVIYV